MVGQGLSDGDGDTAALVKMRWPREDATDQMKARVLAKNMAVNGGIDSTVATVYAFREVFDIPRDRTAAELELSPEMVDEYLATARTRIHEARGLLDALNVAGDDGKGFERRTVRTAVPRAEYRLMHDDFSSTVVHHRGESLAGQLFADDYRTDVAAVYVIEQAGERTDEGAPGYIVERLAPSGACLGKFAVAAGHLQKRIEAGKLVPAELSLDRGEE